jgi:hypothetical protein
MAMQDLSTVYAAKTVDARAMVCSGPKKAFGCNL